MSSSWIYLLSFFLLKIKAEYFNIWSGVFLDADITFIFTPDCSNLLEIGRNFQYFEAVSAHNPYTPIRCIILCRTTSALQHQQGSKSLEIFRYRGTEKSARLKAIFLPLDVTSGYNEIFGELQCEYLIKMSDRVLRQEYIFGHIFSYRDINCFKRAAKLNRGVRLIGFGNGVNSSIFIPCLTCAQDTLNYLQQVSLGNIKQAWDSLNRDMHKFLIYVRNPVNAKCGVDSKGFVNLKQPEFCVSATIAEKYNLTLLQFKGVDKVFLSDRSFGFGIVKMINETKLAEFVYTVTFDPMKFITVTNPSSPASSVTTFVSPFDPATWICILISIISVAEFLTFLKCRGTRHAQNFATTFIDKVMTVTFIFLGNVGESSRKAYRSRKISLLLVTIWLFGYLVLMLNFYQGTIYSCITVPLPPPTPRGFEDLVN